MAQWHPLQFPTAQDGYKNVSVDRRMLCSNILEARIWLSEKAWSTDVLERRHGASVRNLLDRISKMRSSSINEKQAVKIEMI
mmetsp:Transcript_43097/g.89730  ORF Transcript_43097/g.89730 Transcript_43097/m.89730 type:complete len:82 (-) Transcript_43097:383-628(-)